MSRKSGGSTPGGRICNRTVCGKSQGNSKKWLERSEPETQGKSQGSSKNGWNAVKNARNAGENAWE